jgi:hypothetical protein
MVRMSANFDPVRETCEIPEGWGSCSRDWPARTYRKHTGSPLDLPSKTIKAGVHGVAGGEAMLRELDGTVRYLTGSSHVMGSTTLVAYCFVSCRIALPAEPWWRVK